MPLFSRFPRRAHRRRARNNHFQSESLESRTLLTNLLVTVENLSPEGGLFATPFWVGFHDGSFDIGTAGESADDFGGLEEIAEGGDTSVLSERFAEETGGTDATITAPGGFEGAPVFDTGETVQFEIDVENPRENRYFSFASMVIPSNDAFFANLDSTAYRVLSRGGRLIRPVSINLYGNSVYDAGTEVNDPMGGAAFSTEGGDSVDEGGVIMMSTGLDDFVGTGTPVGELQSAFTAQTPLARITISRADRPSDPIDREGPMATLGEISDISAGDETIGVSVTYTDASGVDVSTIDPADIHIVTSGTVGRRVLRATSVNVDADGDSDPRTVTATYTFPAPGGEIDAADSGNYSVRIRRGRVRDVVGRRGNRNARAILGETDVSLSVALNVTVENLAESGGLYLTPFFVGVHDGSFDIGSRGREASRFAGLEEVAEGGDTSVLTDRFNETVENGTATTIVAPSGFEGAPVFDPGETVTQRLDVTNPGENRFFSFASMVIPSNDAFIANLNQYAHRLFSRRGQFRGPVEIMVYGRDVYDSGTEVNDPMGGAAFSTEGGESADESGRIRRSRGLDDFIGTGLPTGNNLAQAFDRRTPIARIVIDLAGNEPN